MTRRRKNRIVLTTGMALAVMLAWLLFRPGPVLESKPLEVGLTDLQRMDGRLFQKNHTAPFTGFAIEHYKDGALKSRSRIVDGVLDGVSEGWYANGQLQIREHFRNGTSHGQRTKWHASGQKLSEVMIADGKLSSTFRRWHENGTLSEQIELKNGQPDGLSFSWHPSGNLKAKARLAAGKVLENQFWQDEEQVTLAE